MALAHPISLYDAGILVLALLDILVWFCMTNSKSKACFILLLLTFSALATGYGVPLFVKKLLSGSLTALLDWLPYKTVTGISPLVLDWLLR